MRQAAASSEHGLRATVKKTPSKLGKKGGITASVKGSPLFQAKVAKMPGGRIKGASTVPQAKGQDDHDKRSAESIVEEAKVEVQHESRKQSSAEGDLLLQWGQRKRLRGRQEPKNAVEDSAGPLKAAIRVDRRVVRADKFPTQGQQPGGQFRTQALKPLASSTPQDNANNTAKRLAEAANGHNVAAPMDGSHCQSGGGQRRAEEADRNGGQCPETFRKDEGGKASTSGGPGAVNGSLATPMDMDFGQDRGHAAEKVNLDHFEWPKFLIPLTRKEKEDDFLIIKGSKLSQRPKKRPKTVEKALHFICPGSFLCEMTRERYEVREKKSVKKKPRGLKAMGAESDSD